MAAPGGEDRRCWAVYVFVLRTTSTITITTAVIARRRLGHWPDRPRRCSTAHSPPHHPRGWTHNPPPKLTTKSAAVASGEPTDADYHRRRRLRVGTREVRGGGGEGRLRLWPVWEREVVLVLVLVLVGRAASPTGSVCWSCCRAAHLQGAVGCAPAAVGATPAVTLTPRSRLVLVSCSPPPSSPSFLCRFSASFWDAPPPPTVHPSIPLGSTATQTRSHQASWPDFPPPLPFPFPPPPAPPLIHHDRLLPPLPAVACQGGIRGRARPATVVGPGRDRLWRRRRRRLAAAAVRVVVAVAVTVASTASALRVGPAATVAPSRPIGSVHRRCG